MKCYYEVLGVPRTVDDDDLKKAYRKLALQWHPDKNLSNCEEAKVQFQLVQQAYEVLSDPQERTWYDRHRDAILKGGIGDNYKDESLDVYQYFTSSCYVGYKDDDKGFYSVYSEVFNKIAAEDSEFNDDLDSDFEIPSFGKSDSLYEEVNTFYSYWQSYTTKKSYAWLDIYDIRQADNRRVLRLMEKENKKVRETARKERNEEVRALVAFVRKRDKRVQAHAKLLQEKSSENARKAEQNRLVKIKQRREEIDSVKEVEWSKFSNLESELKDIEANLVAEFDDKFSDCSVSSKEDDIETNSSSLYCVACNKIFKTVKAFANHENSKKHKENVDILKHDMKKEEEEYAFYASDEYNEDSDKNYVEDSSNVELEDEDNTCNPGIDESFNNEKQIDIDIPDRFDCSNNIIKNNSNDSDVSIELKDNSEIVEKETLRSIKKSKKKHKKQISSDVFTSDDEFDPLEYQSKKQRKKQLQQSALKNKIEQEDENVTIGQPKENFEEEMPEIKTKGKKAKKQMKVTNESNGDKVSVENEEASFSKIYKGKRNSNKKCISVNGGKQNDVKDFNTLCAMCNTAFSSRQKLFDHLKKTGHAVPLSTSLPPLNKKAHKKY